MTEYNPKNKSNNSVAAATKVWVSVDSGVVWRSLGNIVENTLTPALERLEHKSNYRGLDKLDNDIVIGNTFEGNITLDELVKHNMQWLLLSSIRSTAQSYAVPDSENKVWPDGETIEVNGGDAISSILGVYHLSDDDAYDEGATADYTVDLPTATLTKVVGSSIIDDEEVIIDFATTETCTKYNLMDTGDVEAQVKIIHKNTLGPKHCIFLPSVKLSLDGDFAFPKDAWTQAVLHLRVLEDDTYGYGQWYNF